MQRTTVKSSNLASVGYDAAEHILEVEFISGVVYQYDDVPSDVHTALMAAASHGSYFMGEIWGVFPTRRMN